VKEGKFDTKKFFILVRNKKSEAKLLEIELVEEIGKALAFDDAYDYVSLNKTGFFDHREFSTQAFFGGVFFFFSPKFFFPQKKKKRGRQGT